MIKGIAFALGACMIWGLIFVVPQFMGDFTSVEVAMGRYFFYGLISSLIFLKRRLSSSLSYPWSVWKRALLLSLASSFGYYIFLVLALRSASPAISALVIGISPITISFYGNLRKRECSFKSLIIPALLILVGLAVINVPHLMKTSSSSAYLFGVLCSFWSLATWSWFVVANASFLKQNPEIVSNEWSTLLGVATFFWTAVVALALSFFGDAFSPSKFVTPSPDLLRFVLGGAILGLICSWVGAFFWNKASLYLPVSFAGQMTIFETIFGLIYVYLLAQKLPPQLEFLAIVLFMAAIAYSIRTSRKLPSETSA